MRQINKGSNKKQLFTRIPFLLLSMGFVLFLLVNSSQPTAASGSDLIIYAANRDAEIIEINLSLGTAQQVGTLAFGTQAIAQDPATGYVYYFEESATSAGNHLAYWNPATGTNTIVRTYNPAPGFFAKRMAFHPNGLIFLVDENEWVRRLDKNTGNITTLGPVSGANTGSSTVTGDIAFTPAGLPYLASYRNLFTVNNSLQATAQYSNMLTGSAYNLYWTGLAYCEGLLYASHYESDQAETYGLSSMYSIDPGTGVVNELFALPSYVNDLTSCPAVASANNRPAANDQAVNVDENTAVSITLTGSDADGDPLNYSVADSPANGSLSGTAPNLTYTPNTDFLGNDSFTFQVDDGLANSFLATVSITVVEVNTIPVADNQSVNMNENTSTAITLTGSDADGDALTYSVVSSPANGSLSGTAPNLTYTPNANYAGTDSFTFKANDGADDSNVATVSITIANVNTAPAADNQSLSTNEDVPVAITLTGSDADGDALTYSLVSSPANGSLNGSLPNVTYSPNAGYVGADSFTFKVNDGAVDSNVATVSITVVEVNAAPVANNQSLATDENTAVSITLTASDADGDPLTYSVVGAPANGSLSGTAPNLTYTPNASYVGLDSFTFKVNDGTVDSNVATVDINVAGVNTAPVANNQSASTDENVAVAITLTGSDAEGDALTYSVVGLPAHGNLSGSAPHLTYTPHTNYVGADSFTFKVNDGMVDSSVATVSITVANVNVAPVANNQSVSLNENTAVGITLTGSDADGDALTYSVVGLPAHGNLSGSAPNLTYTSNTNYVGADSFTFIVNDGAVDSSVATVSITVINVNAVPVANNQSVSTQENTAVPITLTASDADGDALTYSIVGSPANGSLSGTAPNLIYTPNTNYSGFDSFTFKVNDGAVDSNVATISIAVNGPDVIIYGGNRDEAAILEINLTQNTAQQVGTLAFGTVATEQDPATGYVYYFEKFLSADEFAYWDPATGTNTIVRTYNPSPGIFVKRMAFHPNGTLYIMDNSDILYTIDKNNGDITLIGQVAGLESGPLNGTGDMAFAPDGTHYVVTYGNLYTIDSSLQPALLYADMLPINNDIVTWTGLAFCDGTLYASHIEADAAQTSGYSAMYTIDLGTGAINQLFALPTYVNDLTSCPPPIPWNNTPIADAQAVNTNENTPVAFTLTGSDADGDPLAYTVVSSPVNGSLSGTVPNLTYTPNTDFVGADSFTFMVNDGAADSNVATVSITVAGMNMAPATDDQTVYTDENTAVSITLTGSDADGDALTYNVVGAPVNGSLSGTAPNLTYSPAAGFSGLDSFTFEASDGTAVSNLATVSIYVTGQNDTIIYASNRNGEMIAVNLTHNFSHQVGTLAFGTQAMEQDPVTGYVYYFEEKTIGNGDQFAYWNPATNTSTIVRTYNPVPDFYAKRLAFHPDGTLYLMDDYEHVYSIDKQTGDITFVSQVIGINTGWITGTGDNAFAPDGTFYIATYRNLYTVDSNWQATELYSNMLVGSAYRLVWTGLAYCDGMLYGSHFEGDEALTYGLSKMYSIDPGTGNVTELFDLPTYVNDLTSCPVIPSANTAPVANNQSVNTDENTAVDITLTGSDVNGDTLTYSIVSLPVNGSLSGSAPNLTYTPNSNFIGGDSFTFQVSDGTAVSNPATISITVNAQNNLILYGSNDNGELIEINITQNTAQVVSTLAFGTYAIEQDASTGYVYYFEQSAAGDQFAYWNPATGTNTIVRTYNPSPGISVRSMAFHPNGFLFILADNDWVYRMDKTNGNITALGPVNGLVTGSVNRPSDIAFAPDATPYLATYRNLYRVSLTLQPTLLYGNMLPVNNDIVTWTGLAYCDGILYASHLESNAAQTNKISKMYSINPNTGLVSELFTLPTHVNDITSCATN